MFGLQCRKEIQKDQLHPNVKRVIGHIHIPLLDWALKEINYENTNYISSLMQGRPMIGEIEKTGVFLSFRNPATTTMKERKKGLPWSRRE